MGDVIEVARAPPGSAAGRTRDGGHVPRRHHDLTTNADLWVITTFFNSENYRTRAENYHRFMDALDRSGVPCLTVECAFGDAPFTLPAGDRVLHRRSPSVLWQKERLLNVALRALPSTCRYIAWIDADVLFDDPAWFRQTARLLDDTPVIQLFDSFVRLPKGDDSYRGVYEDKWVGFCAQVKQVPGCEREGWYSHGHTGFAWAARREVLDACGFFDLCLTGSGDHLMAHGFLADFNSRCIDHMIGLDTPLHREYVRWAETASSLTGGRLGFQEGSLSHLWHGDLQHRRYHERSQEMKVFAFEPSVELRVAADGCWTWAGSNAPLKEWAHRLFADRREDGEPARIPHKEEYDWPPEWRTRRSN
jgi:hypothetical protein